MAAATYHFPLEAGAAEPLRVTWRAPGTSPSLKVPTIDLTGWSAKFELRDRTGAQQPVLALTSA